MKSLVFLVHGFRSDSASMNDIAKILKKDFYPVLVELPITFQSLDKALLNLKQIVLDYMSKSHQQELFFIGHSTGGIIIRMLMKDRRFAAITKICIFIGAPNHGTELAEIHQSLPYGIKEIHQPIKFLTPKFIASMGLQKPENTVYAGIAGNQSLDLTNIFFTAPNDGIVTVQSVFLEEMKDFIILPYNHYHIHHQLITCLEIRFFLLHMRFRNKLKEVYHMTIGEKFCIIIRDGYINELCAQLRGNIDFATAGGLVFWDNLGEYSNWKLQQNKLSRHLRILNPDNIRKAWGVERKVSEAINHVYSRLKIEQNTNELIAFDRNEKPIDVYDKIKKLNELFKENIITEAEFNAKKEKLLSEI